MVRALAWCGLVMIVASSGCAIKPGQELKRRGDEIVVAGLLFHTGTRVVLWMDEGGYDAYRAQRRFSQRGDQSWEPTSSETKTPYRYDLRFADKWDDEKFEQLRGGGWDLPTLRQCVNKFVIHYDVCGTSRRCFQILHDVRGISVQFMLDADGTIYQTLDLKERARQSGEINDTSIGIEIANIGAYPPDDPQHTLSQWYDTDAKGRTALTLPQKLLDGTTHWPRGFVPRPIRPQPVVGVIQGQSLQQYDFTPQQYAALIKLTAALTRIFPKMEVQVPRDENGRVLDHALTPEQLEAFHGIVGHYHVTTRKIDPGPAFQWDRLLDGVRKELD